MFHEAAYSVDCFVNKWERNFWFHLETPSSTGTDNETGFQVCARGQTIQWPKKTGSNDYLQNSIQKFKYWATRTQLKTAAVNMLNWCTCIVINVLAWIQYTITALCVGEHPDLSTWGGSCFPEGLGFSAGNNRVVSRQRKFFPLFHRLSPLWEKIGLFGGEQ